MFNKAPSKQLLRVVLCMFCYVIEDKIPCKKGEEGLIKSFQKISRNKMSDFFIAHEIKGGGQRYTDHENGFEEIDKLSVISARMPNFFSKNALGAGKKVLRRYTEGSQPEDYEYIWGEKTEFTRRGELDSKIISCYQAEKPSKQTAQNLCDTLEYLFEIHQEAWYLYDEKRKSIKDLYDQNGEVHPQIEKATELVISSYFLYKCAQHLMFKHADRQHNHDFHKITSEQKEAVEYLRKYINDANFMMLDKSRIKWSLKHKGIDPRILLAYLEPHEIASIQTALDPLHKIPLLSLLTHFLLTIFYTLIPSNKTEELEKNLEILRDGIKADFRKELEKENSYTR